MEINLPDPRLAGMELARYGRQVLLREVGHEGQGRVLRATAAVGGETLAHRAAVRFALRSGFHGVSPGAVDVESLAPSSIVTVPAARSILAGARCALAAFRSEAVDAHTTRGPA